MKSNSPADIEDCKCAIRYLRANATGYEIDRSRIGIAGASSGGTSLCWPGRQMRKRVLRARGLAVVTEPRRSRRILLWTEFQQVTLGKNTEVGNSRLLVWRGRGGFMPARRAARESA